MNIKLDKRITVQKCGPVETNDNGFPTKADGYSDYKTIWGSINNLFGKEFWAAKTINSENTVEVIIRYSKEFEELNSKTYRIKWKDRVFNITFVDNIRYENKWIKIKAIEVI
ncbi:phage head closure protein [Clostridium tunisiense]|uniref:phage head closure protein n=1 Tax=Clostridium tunisiense TaxID=219748 RepID=UPI0002E7AAD9|nr:phage head closure protein [Clostridium tunisiense]